MAVDFAAQIGATHRLVRNAERDGKPVKVVVLSRVYNTNQPDLWEALTRPERLERWFAPVTGELSLGGRYQVQGNASGTISECNPPSRLALTWEFGGNLSWVNVTLSPDKDGTRLELEHIAPVDAHWQKFGPGATGVGWDLALYGLVLHLANPTAHVSKEGEAWMMSDEGKDFVRQAAAGWGRAAIAAGEPEAEALASAERTRKFYSGEPTD
jgi:uncharacterized protein YndB with AHSA1/START domain